MSEVTEKDREEMGRYISALRDGFTILLGGKRRAVSRSEYREIKTGAFAYAKEIVPGMANQFDGTVYCPFSAELRGRVGNACTEFVPERKPAKIAVQHSLETISDGKPAKTDGNSGNGTEATSKISEVVSPGPKPSTAVEQILAIIKLGRVLIPAPEVCAILSGMTDSNFYNALRALENQGHKFVKANDIERGYRKYLGYEEPLPPAPPGVDPEEWKDFQIYLKWKAVKK